MTSRRDPWERLDGETDPAFRAFTTYRDMGLERSHAKVARELGKSKTLISGWSTKWQWLLRTQSFDDAIDREWVNEVKVMRRRAAKRNASAAALAMQKAGAFLVNLDVEQLDANSAARIADVFSRIERLALGSDDVHLVGAGVGAAGSGRPDATGAAAALSDEDRRARLLMLRREVDGRLSEYADPDALEEVLDDDDPYAED